MTDHAEPYIADHLEAGERLLWSGAPRQGMAVRRSHWAFIGTFLGLAIALLVASKLGLLGLAPSDLPYVTIPALVIFFLLFHLHADSERRSGVRYGVTDRRILILREPSQSRLDRLSGTELPPSGLTSLALRDLSDVRLRQRSDGSGTVAFGGYRRAPRLERIADAERVAGLIEEARKAARTGGLDPKGRNPPIPSSHGELRRCAANLPYDRWLLMGFDLIETARMASPEQGGA